MQLTKNFQLSEFDCRDGTPVPTDLIPNVHRLADNLQVFRDFINLDRKENEPEYKVKITSGYRTPEYNGKQPGASSGSYHMKALAGDIKVYQIIDDKKKWVHPDKTAFTIETLIASGKMEQGGLGRYNTFTHYDPRGYKARWDKRK